MQPDSQKKLTLQVLEVLAVGAFIATVIAFPGLALLFQNRTRRFKTLPPQQFKKTLWYLSNKGFVKIQQAGNRNILRITNQGKARLKNYNFEHLTIPHPQTWDKKWRLVIFDIPESRKTAREFFRRKLQALNFYPVQKSVYAFPFECASEVDLVATLCGVKPFFMSLTVPAQQVPGRVHDHFKKLRYL